MNPCFAQMEELWALANAISHNSSKISSNSNSHCSTIGVKEIRRKSWIRFKIRYHPIKSRYCFEECAQWSVSWSISELRKSIVNKTTKLEKPEKVLFGEATFFWRLFKGSKSVVNVVILKSALFGCFIYNQADVCSHFHFIVQVFNFKEVKQQQESKTL